MQEFNVLGVHCVSEIRVSKSSVLVFKVPESSLSEFRKSEFSLSESSFKYIRVQCVRVKF